MNKMTLALIALFGLAFANVEARRGSCSSCNTCETKSCGAKYTESQDCAEVPQCFQWRKVPVCAQKHVYYTCPEDSNIGPCECTEREKVHGGNAANY